MRSHSDRDFILFFIGYSQIFLCFFIVFLFAFDLDQLEIY